MGFIAKGLVSNAAEIVKHLRHAYADEWFAHYNFRYVGFSLRGHRSPSVVEFLQRRSREALSRADRLGARIMELGGAIPARLTELCDDATDKPFKLPGTMADVDGVLRAVLDAERTSLKTFGGLISLTTATDPLTHRLAVDCLTSAVRNEQTVERLLGSAATEMDGT